MAKKEAKIDYDEENDILYAYTGEKIKDSLEMDRFVIDFSHDNKIVAVEVMNVSEHLDKAFGIKVSKPQLSNVKTAQIRISESRDVTYVTILLSLKIDNELREIQLQVQPPAAAVQA